MKRVNGYRDLDEYFKRILKRKNIDRDILEAKKVIRQELGGASSMFWFKYFGVDVLFKCFESEYQVFSELISQELANHLGFRTAQYDAATFEGRKGVISYNFKKEGYTYVPLFEILDEYEANIRYDEKDHNTFKDYYISEYISQDRDYIITNLEDIWNALEMYFTKFPNKNDIVENLMDKLTDYFCYQIISGNYDLHASNILVAIAKDNTDADLAPIYDNEDMFQLSEKVIYKFPNTPRLMVSREDVVIGLTAHEMLEEYLKISDGYFVGKFKRLVSQLNQDTIFELIKEVEKRIEIEIPYDIKFNISMEFNNNLNEINKIIESQYMTL